MKQPKIYNTAMYMRLSRDDESYGDSVSIETQRTILRKYAAENSLHVVDEYIDDGWSGTNFERPSFKRMMADVDAGKVNCIVTKDLSRFGREHVMMDYYLEFVFPEKQIRYIAVTENEDTERGLSDFVPFKNLFNEWFAKDTSRKVKAALRAKHARGERTFTYAPLGYKRDPEKKNALVIDEDTKWIVEKIFNLAANGAGAGKIRQVLLNEKVPTPGWINYSRYGTFANIYANAPDEKRYDWSLAQVKTMLKDETYIGNTIHNRQTNISYKNKKRVRKPEDEWIRVENTHKAIIGKDLFSQVQEQIANRRRKMKTGETHIFAGLIKCADCGKALSISTHAHSVAPYRYFNCTTYRQYSKSVMRCSPHYIRYDVLYIYVLDRVRYWAKQAEIDEGALLQRLLKAGDKERLAASKKQAGELAKAEKRRAELDRLFAKMYEDWAAGRITEYNFNMLSEKYQGEQKELDEKIQQLHEAMEAVAQTAVDAEKWVGLMRQYVNPTELTAELLNTLIEKIFVHEAVKGEDGSREQEVEIFYRFIGKID